jgi:hypothetical protein
VIGPVYSDAFAHLLAEVHGAQIEARRVVQIRVSELGLVGSPITVPYLADGYRPGDAELEVLVHPDDWQVIAGPFWAVMHDGLAPVAGEFFGIPVVA